jgi:hypothetical protein
MPVETNTGFIRSLLQSGDLENYLNLSKFSWRSYESNLIEFLSKKYPGEFIKSLFDKHGLIQDDQFS